jgi:hypothetical protein
MTSHGLFARMSKLLCTFWRGDRFKARQFYVLCIAAIAVAAISLAIHRHNTAATLTAVPQTVAVANIDEQLPSIVTPSATHVATSEHKSLRDDRDSLLLHDQNVDSYEQKREFDTPNTYDTTAREAKLEDSPQSSPTDSTPPKRDFSYLAYYAYAEVLPDQKPADTVLETLKGIPVGTPVEEIKLVSDALGLDFDFMRAVAKIESDFDPKQRTGSYIGLFQLSKREFQKYGSGNITDARDNTVAAVYKFLIETKLFELDTHKRATMSDIYLVHQQGLQGAAEHINNPDRIAWESMCATDEGREKGKKWCKRAIWGNTIPTIKRAWKSVTKLTSGAFVAMWQQRVAHFYARYSGARAEKKEATAEKKDR